MTNAIDRIRAKLLFLRWILYIYPKIGFLDIVPTSGFRYCTIPIEIIEKISNFIDLQCLFSRSCIQCSRIKGNMTYCDECYKFIELYLDSALCSCSTTRYYCGCRGSPMCSCYNEEYKIEKLVFTDENDTNISATITFCSTHNEDVKSIEYYIYDQLLLGTEAEDEETYKQHIDTIADKTGTTYTKL